MSGTFDPPIDCIILALKPQKYSGRLNASWLCQLRCFVGIGAVYNTEVGSCTSVRLRWKLLGSTTCTLLYATENCVLPRKLLDLEVID